ncbi:MAG: TerB family tellurite resistance protein, partial [Planctomycetota bacterium]|nr:TerB family tellurite resistance protein [Planctomycetota bacterium]
MLDPLAEYQKARETIEQAICRVMIAMMLSDGDINEAEKKVVYEIFTHLAGEELSEAQFQREKTNVEMASFDLSEYLQSIAEELNDDGKEKVMRGAFMVAAADGVFHDEER